MKRLQKFSIYVALIFMMTTTTGCFALFLGAAAGAGGVSYYRGSMVKNIDSTVPKIHKASLATLKDMKLFVTADELNKRSAVIRAEYADGQKVKIFADALTEYVSKVTIRIGVFGDREESQYILNAIEKEL